MADPTPEEFASWLRPRDALSRLGIAIEAASKSEVAKRIVDGRVRIAGLGPGNLGGEPGRAPQSSVIDLNYLNGPWIAEWGEFWSLGTFSFVRAPIARGGFASLTIVGSQAPFLQPEIHLFRKVRLDPVAMAREFDLDLTGTTDAAPGAVPPLNKGGRPGGKDGQPIALVTKRMLTKSAEELQRYTAEALSVELKEEYPKLGLKPPTDLNALRNAAGILRVVRR